MHVIKARKGPGASSTVTGKAIITGSGLGAMTAAKATPASSQAGGKSVPPSTRQLARDYAAFYGMEGENST